MPTTFSSADRTTALERARTFLFVPGNRPERFAKALASGADAVVLDLEDAVPVGDKSMARDAVGAAWPDLERSGTPVVLRVNASSTPEGRNDREWLATGVPLAAIMVPKAESTSDLDAFERVAAACPLLPLIETAAGFAGIGEIAGHRRVLRLVFGHIDFVADTGLRCSPDERELDPVRFAMAIQTRLHRLAPAVDGVTVAIHDGDRLRADVARALNFGFGGKLCIHPRQVEGIHAAMAPDASELDWARRVVAADAASGGAALQLDGRMIDLPVVLQARWILSRAAS